jgi:hypothetical protein
VAKLTLPSVSTVICAEAAGAMKTFRRAKRKKERKKERKALPGQFPVFHDNTPNHFFM